LSRQQRRALEFRARRRRRQALGALAPGAALAVGAVLAGAAPARAATFVVTNVADAGTGSLRQAFLDAQANPDADLIVFDTAGVFATPQTITLLDPLPQYPTAGGPLTIQGPGATRLTLRRDPGAANFRILSHAGGAAPLLITGVTLTGGNVVGDGGAIFYAGGGAGSAGSLTVTDCAINGNAATAEGGAIYVGGLAPLMVQRSVISGNTAGTDGGGIYLFSGNALTLEDSTISGNTANGTGVGGGGVYHFGGGEVVIRGSTIANNTSAGNGGGLVQATGVGTITIENSTITGNSAALSGGGLARTSGSKNIIVRNSTIAGNSAGGTAAGTGGGGIGVTSMSASSVTLANSVVSGNTNANGPDVLASVQTTVNVNFSAVGANDGFLLSGTSGNNLAPGTNLMLGPLANNGGGTSTHQPALGSPLINAGSNALAPALPFDQRGPGFDRIAQTTVDIGAVELNPPKVTINQAVTQPDPTRSGPILFTVAFDRAVTGFTASDVSLAGTTVGGTPVVSMVGSGAAYTVAVTGMNGLGTVVASVPADVAVDAAGSPNAASTSLDNTVTFDNVAPTVTLNTAAGQPDPTHTSPILFTVVFNEDVTGFTGSDVSFAGSTTGGLVAAVSGGGASYTVSVTGMDAPGTVVAALAAGAATDLAGNVSVASTSMDNMVAFTASADLSVTKTDGQTTAAPGQPLTYTIVASNAGPHGVTGAMVSDPVLGALASPSWTCVGVGGGNCTATGTANIADAVDLPVGGTVTYTVTGTVRTSAVGTLTNTVTIEPPAGVTEVSPGDNSATDADFVLCGSGIGDLPTVRRLSIGPGIEEFTRLLAVLGENCGGFTEVHVLGFDEKGNRHGSGFHTFHSDPVVALRGDGSVRTSEGGRLLVLGAGFHLHEFEVGREPSGELSLAGPHTRGPFGEVEADGHPTAFVTVASPPGPLGSWTAIGTDTGRLVLIHEGERSSDISLLGPIRDLAVVPQVGYWAIVALVEAANGPHLVGIQLPADPRERARERFDLKAGSDAPDLVDLAAPPSPIEGQPLPEPAAVSLLASDGTRTLHRLTIPADPGGTGGVEIAPLDAGRTPIADVAGGSLALRPDDGAGVLYDRRFDLGRGGLGRPLYTLFGSSLDVRPRSLRQARRQRFLETFIEVADGKATQILPDSVVLQVAGTFMGPPPGSTPRLGDADRDGNADLMVKFRAAGVESAVPPGASEVRLHVHWIFADGSRGMVSTPIRVHSDAGPEGADDEGSTPPPDAPPPPPGRPPRPKR
jgi:uncharacterized repeat protein (TIGR01451 family)